MPSLIEICDPFVGEKSTCRWRYFTDIARMSLIPKQQQTLAFCSPSSPSPFEDMLPEASETPRTKGFDFVRDYREKLAKTWIGRHATEPGKANGLLLPFTNHNNDLQTKSYNVYRRHPYALPGIFMPLILLCLFIILLCPFMTLWYSSCVFHSNKPVPVLVEWRSCRSRLCRSS